MLDPNSGTSSIATGSSSGFLNNLTNAVNTIGNALTTYVPTVLNNLAIQAQNYVNSPASLTQTPSQYLYQQTSQAYNTGMPLATTPGQTNSYYQTYGTGFNQVSGTPAQPVYVTVQPQPVWINIPDFGTTLFQNLPAMIQQLLPMIPGIGTAVGAVQQTINNMTSGGIDKLANQLDTTISQLGHTISGGIDYALAQVTNTVSQMTSGMSNIASNLYNAVQANQAGLPGILNSVNAALNSAINTITNNSDASIKAIQQLVAEKPLPQTDDLITRFGGFINKIITDFGQELQTDLIATLKSAEQNPNNFIFQLGARIDNISYVVDNLKANKYKSSEAFFNDLFGNQPATGLARGLIILASVIPTLISAINMAGEPALEAFQHLVQQDSPVKLLSMNDYLTAYFKNIIQYGELKDKAGKQGISEAELKTLIYASYTDPDFGTMIQAKRRGIIDDKKWGDYLVDQRIRQEDKIVIEQVMNLIPNVQDLTRIADKRIWSGQTAPKYGQYDELPQQYLDYMKQQGYDEQFTKWFWAAHWNLPSPNQIFEMYQRHVITQEDMQTYLALTDWLPFFRDKLLQISYNPLTRVDIRRMYSLGMFTYDELITRYEAIGFSPDDARLMADFTVKYEGSEGSNDLEKLKNKIVSAVEGLFVRGKITKDEALNRLVALGKDRQFSDLSLNYLVLEQSLESTKPKLEAYKTRAINLIVQSYLKGHYSKENALAGLLEAGLSQVEADEELKYADIERNVQVQQSIIDTLELRYLTNVYSQAEFISQLGFMGLNAGEINQAVVEADYKKEKRVKLPTEKQVIDWFTKGLIDENYVITYLQAFGYPDNIIPLVMAGDFGIGVQQ